MGAIKSQGTSIQGAFLGVSESLSFQVPLYLFPMDRVKIFTMPTKYEQLSMDIDNVVW